jgi:hypothetical protein
MLAGDGETVTVGAVAAAVTVSEFVPTAFVYVAVLAASGVYVAVSVSVPLARDPAGTLMVALPPLSVVAPDV